MVWREALRRWLNGHVAYDSAIKVSACFELQETAAGQRAHAIKDFAGNLSLITVHHLSPFPFLCLVASENSLAH